MLSFLYSGKILLSLARLAQLVERRIYTANVGGSSPSARTLMVEGKHSYTLPTDRLSRRELQVVGMYANGMREGGIACGLGISKRTVSVHRTHIQTKLDTATIADSVVTAFEAQQLDLDSFVNDDDLIKTTTLTRREKEVFAAIFRHRKISSRISAICDDLVITVSTAGCHILNMNKKLGINSEARAALLYYAADQRGMKLG